LRSFSDHINAHTGGFKRVVIQLPAQQRQCQSRHEARCSLFQHLGEAMGICQSIGVDPRGDSQSDQSRDFVGSELSCVHYCTDRRTAGDYSELLHVVSQGVCDPLELEEYYGGERLGGSARCVGNGCEVAAFPGACDFGIFPTGSVHRSAHRRVFADQQVVHHVADSAEGSRASLAVAFVDTFGKRRKVNV
jgi:hypothetical protein